MRAIIVDDEPLARSLLCRLLEKEAVKVVGEADGAEEGLALAEALTPELVFLEVRMAGLSGVEATSIFTQLEPAPLVILVTGCSDYAVEAFGRAAFDYLLKPVSSERLLLSLSKARRLLALQRKAKHSEALRKAIARSPVLRLPVASRGAIRLIPVEKIQYAMAVQKHVLIHLKDSNVRTSMTLTQLEAILPSTFMRTHSSCVVNITIIDEILLLGNHTYVIRTLGGEELPLGRLQYAKLRDQLGLKENP